MFATAGKDKIVRIYDEATKTMVSKLSSGWGSISGGRCERGGHSNRVFSLKFKPDDPNLLISGGWDDTVQVCQP